MPRTRSKEESTTTKIVLADDHAVVRDGLLSLLSADPALEVVGLASNGDELLAILETKSCDIAVMDLSMPGTTGLKALKLIAEKHPAVKVIILTMHREPQFFRQASASPNMFGYILKDDAYRSLRDAIHTVKNGGRSYSDSVQNAMMEDYRSLQGSYIALDVLSKRELEILRLIAQGKMNKEIARELFISARTVESHRTHIMEKLRIDNLVDLVKFAVQHGLG